MLPGSARILSVTEETVNLWVERLTAHARSGEVLDLTEGVTEAELLDPTTADQWPAQRRIPASAIRATVVQQDLKPDPRGLGIRGADVVGALDLNHVTVPCPLSLIACRLQQDADLTFAHFVELNLPGTHTHRMALDGTRVDGDLFLDQLQANGRVRAAAAEIGGQLLLQQAVLDNTDGPALDLDSVRVDGGVFADGLQATGEVRALGAQIGSQLQLRRAVLTNEGRDALFLDAFRASGMLADGLQATGRVRALGAQIGGQLELQRAVLTNEAGDALSLDGLRASSVVLTGLQATGQVRAHGAQIDGQLGLSNAVLLANEKGDALNLEGVRVGGSVSAAGLQATGQVSAVGAQIGGQLNLRRAVLANRDGPALNLDQVAVGDGVFADELDATGAVRALGTKISGHLDLKRAVLVNEAGKALHLDSASVGTLCLRGKTKITGHLDLTGTEIGGLVVDEQAGQGGLPGALCAAGWRLRDVYGALRTDRAVAASWLDSRPESLGFVAQPWHELAAVYERNGQPADARWLRWQAARRTTKHSSWWSKPLRWAYGGLVGHGYYPMLAAAWLVVALVAATILTGLNLEAFTPTDPAAATEAVQANSTGTPPVAQPVIVTGDTDCGLLTPGYSCLNPALYALTVVVPPAAAIQNADWAPNDPGKPYLVWALTALKASGWLLTVLMLAGMTGLLRKT
jgi:hypothetical protein